MNPVAPVPADDELINLRRRLRAGLARVAKKGRTCRNEDSRLFRLKEKATRLIDASRYAQIVDEESEAASPSTKVSNAHEEAPS